MKKKRYNYLIILGWILILAGLLFWGYNFYDDYVMGKKSQEVIVSLSQAIEKKEPSNQFVDNMPTKNINGNDYIGMINIPKIQINLPVLSSWSYALLKIAPNYYSGSYYTNDLVICAHNNWTHFGKLKKLQPNDELQFITANGEVMKYQVTNLTVIEATHIDEMIVNYKKEKSREDWDLTLFTCTPNGIARLAIRAKRI